MQYAYDPQDFFAVQKKDSPQYSGPCKYHTQFFGKELIVFRDARASLGYYVCEDCKREKRKVDELKYVRKNGKPVRSSHKMRWDTEKEKFVRR